MEAWRKCFGEGLLKVIGMIHVPALPGTPRNVFNMKKIISRVIDEANIFSGCGVDGVLVENMHDVPYLHSAEMGPEITAAMARVCSEVRKNLPSSVTCGVQILAAANKEALAIAVSSELQFIRCEGFVFSHIADEGWTDSCAAELMRYRKTLSAEEVLVFCDLKKKHSSHAITGDVDVGGHAAAAQFFLADGLIVTGNTTGHAADVTDLDRVRAHSSLPVLIGSGITADNIDKFRHADGVIVGSYFKKHGRWDQDLEEEKISKLMMEVRRLRCSVK